MGLTHNDIFAQGFLDNVDIIIDSREHAKSPFFREYFSSRGVKISIMKLEEGDFAIPAPPGTPGALIERKTLEDLINSIANGRIWSQIDRLHKVAIRAGAEAYLIVEGDVSVVLSRRGFHPNAMFGFQEAIQRKTPIILLFSPGKKATADWILKKVRDRREQQHLETSASCKLMGKTVVSPQVKHLKASVNDKILAIATVLAGKELGVRLLKNFGTLRNIANASILELKRIPGIGDVRAKEIFSIFNKNVIAILNEKGGRG